MKRTLIFLVFILSTGLFSCKRNELKKEVADFLGQPVSFPNILDASRKGEKLEDADFLDSKLKLIVWFDSVSCSACKINRLHEWEDVTTYANALGDPGFM